MFYFFWRSCFIFFDAQVLFFLTLRFYFFWRSGFIFFDAHVQQPASRPASRAASWSLTARTPRNAMLTRPQTPKTPQNAMQTRLQTARTPLNAMQTLVQSTGTPQNAMQTPNKLHVLNPSKIIFKRKSLANEHVAPSRLSDKQQKTHCRKDPRVQCSLLYDHNQYYILYLRLRKHFFEARCICESAQGYWLTPTNLKKHIWHTTINCEQHICSVFEENVYLVDAQLFVGHSYRIR